VTMEDGRVEARSGGCSRQMPHQCEVWIGISSRHRDVYPAKAGVTWST